MEHRGSRVNELVLDPSRKGVLEPKGGCQDTRLDPVLLLMLYHLDCLRLPASLSQDLRSKANLGENKDPGTMAYMRAIFPRVGMRTLPTYTQSLSIIRLR